MKKSNKLLTTFSINLFLFFGGIVKIKGLEKVTQNIPLDIGCGLNVCLGLDGHNRRNHFRVRDGVMITILIAISSRT